MVSGYSFRAHIKHSRTYTFLWKREFDFIQNVYKILKADNWLTLSQKINNSGSWAIFKKNLIVVAIQLSLNIRLSVIYL